MIVLNNDERTEITHLPQLVALVVDNTVPTPHALQFVEQCALHNCPKAFVAALPHTGYRDAPLTMLARIGALQFATQWQRTFSEIEWQRAARAAGKAGRMDFIQYTLSKADTLKSVLTGACIGNRVCALEGLFTDCHDAGVAAHLPVLAAQHNSKECVGFFLQQGITARVWMSTILVALHQGNTELFQQLLEHVPTTGSPAAERCAKAALLAVEKDMCEPKLLNFIFQHVHADDIVRTHPYLPQDIKDTLCVAYAAYQKLLLSAATHNNGSGVGKRKM